MKRNWYKFSFYTGILLIVLMIYDVSWLPGSYIVFNNRFYIIIFLSLLIVLTEFKLLNFIKLKLKFSSIEFIILSLICVLVIYSTLVYNYSELLAYDSFLTYISYLMIFVLFFNIIPYMLLKKPSLFNTFIVFFSNLGLVLALFGFLDVYLHLNYSNFPGMLLSVIHHPNNTSMLFTVCIIPVLYFIYSKWHTLNVINKFYWLFSLFIQLLAQLFTFTRAGMIASFLSISVFLLLYHRANAIYILPSLGIFAAFFLKYFFFVKGFYSFLSRFLLLIPAYNMITADRSKMLWGYGLTNYLIEFKKYLEIIPNSEITVSDPHNTYVTLVLMLGIIVTFLIVFLTLFLLMKCTFRMLKSSSRSENLFYNFLISSSLSILVQGIFDSELIKTEYFTTYYLALIMGMMFILTFNKKNKYSQYFRELNN